MLITANKIKKLKQLQTTVNNCKQLQINIINNF